MAVDTHVLKVEDYQSCLLLELHNLQKGGHLCDITLQAADGHVMAHGVVLMAASPPLRWRWIPPGSSDAFEKQPNRLDFMRFKQPVLQCVVDYIYTGVLNVTTDILNDALELCSELNLHKAVEVCKHAINVKSTADEKQMGYKEQVQTNPRSLLDSNLYPPPISDHYADSTDVENIVEAVSREKRRKSRKPRKRSHNALGDKNENIDNGKEQRVHKKNELMKPLKVPKLSISLKSKRTEKTVNQTKPRKSKQLKSEKVRKWKKTVKLTERKTKKVRTDTAEKLKRDSDTLVRPDKPGPEENAAANLQSHDSGEEETVDTLDDLIEKDSADTAETAVDENIFPKECHVCKEKFDDMKSFSKHIKTHNVKIKGRRKSKQDVWPCCVCGRQLTTAVRQACHHYSKHGIPYDESLKLHACDVEGCKYITASRHYLQIHKKGRHGNERPHVCEFCGKGFKLPSALVTHLNIHTNNKIYKCEECNLTFNQKGGLDIHDKKHHKGQASWTELCHLCSEKFLQKAELSWHMYTVHQIPLPDRYKVYSCELCDYQTIRKNKLERHQDAHNDNRSWTCDICGKKFVTKSYLNRHLRYHGEKSFKCTFDGCNYACVDNIGLKKHIRLMHTHKNYKPFVCSLCQYKTGLRGNLDKHIRTVHQLDVVTKHTVHLKMKFKGRQSGDILTKDGQLINMIEDHRGEDPRRLQALLDSGEDDQDDGEDKPIDMIMKDGIVYTTGGKPQEEENTTQDSNQLSATTTSATSQTAAFPYVYNGMQYLTPVTQIPYTMVPLHTQVPQGEMYSTIDPMSLTATKFSEFYNGSM